MPNKFVIDTNVLVVAEGRCKEANLECIESCVNALDELKTDGVVCVDAARLIIREYQRNLNSNGGRQPSFGFEFFKWLMRGNEGGRTYLDYVELTETSTDVFLEFPAEIFGFDRTDKKFVAVANKVNPKATIFQAVDTDWCNFVTSLGELGIEVRLLCKDLICDMHARKNT